MSLIQKLKDRATRTLVNTDIMPVQDSAGASWYKTTLAALKNFLYTEILGTENTWTEIQTFNEEIDGDLAGNAATATKLATARTIGGVSFDGTANINLPGVNTAGNQNTSGKAATAGNADTVTNGAYTNAANTFTQTQKFNNGVQNIPDYTGTLPASSADTMGTVGDEIHWRGKIYRKTATGWVVFTGTSF